MKKVDLLNTLMERAPTAYPEATATVDAPEAPSKRVVHVCGNKNKMNKEQCIINLPPYVVILHA